MNAVTSSFRTRVVWCGVLAAWLGWPLLEPASADPDDVVGRVRRGAFIVATENLANTMFERTVILITHHRKTGTMGLAVNRPSEIPLHEAFPEVEKLRGQRGPLFLGGPVNPHAIFVLLQSDRAQSGMQRVAKGVYLSTGIDAIAERPSEAPPGASARAFAGYAGWAAGQLEAEIARGDWIVAWEDPAVAFSDDLKKLWETLLESWSGRWI